MSTEEDTFKSLRRTPFTQLRKEYIHWFRTITLDSCSRSDFFQGHGWTVREFLDKHRELMIKPPHD